MVTNNPFASTQSGNSVEDRVRGAADYGVGLYSLVFSLIPPRFQSAAAALGFGSTSYNRQDSLNKLRRCVDDGTARAPIASLVLLIFHSAMLIFARGVSDSADTREAEYVLDLCLRQYPDSPLFRFFQGRLERGKSRLSKALDAYRFAQLKSNDVVAMADLCAYERAWCCSLLGEHAKAAGLFATLARNSPWSPCFYGYLAGSAHFAHAFCLIQNRLAQDDSFKLSLKAAVAQKDDPLTDARRAMFKACQLFKAVPSAVQRRHGKLIPPEAFAECRAQQFNKCLEKLCPDLNDDKFKHEATWEQLYTLARSLCFPSLEVAYFWNGLFQVTQDRRNQMLAELEKSQRFYSSNAASWASHEALFTLMKGALLRESQCYLEAESVLKYFDEHGGTWGAHFAKFEQGMCRFHQNDKNGAILLWEQVGNSEHFFEPRLRFRVRSAMTMATSSSSSLPS